MSYDQKTQDQLDAFRQARNRTAYYEKLMALRDPYGSMALEAVMDLVLDRRRG